VTTLSKHHGLGNDFLVALEADNPGLAPDASLARSLCDRRRGIGADGLVLGLAPSDPSNDAAMVLLNADGSEAEISGNGIRCLGQAILRRSAGHDGPGSGGTRLSIETAGGLRELSVLRGDPCAEIWMDVSMGEVREGPEPTPASLAYPAARLATLDVGNPHLVLLVDDPGEVDLPVDGPALESGYPAGINVHFVRPTGDHGLELSVWERGAGVTEACGSGATAAAVAAMQWGVVRGPVTVSMPGGEAEVELVGAEAHLRGPATFVAEVVVP
jgi:diaminopimelate epimerase